MPEAARLLGNAGTEKTSRTGAGTVDAYRCNSTGYKVHTPQNALRLLHTNENKDALLVIITMTIKTDVMPCGLVEGLHDVSEESSVSIFRFEK